MARRPVFIPDPQGSLVREKSIEFEWFPGQATVRKQLNIESLHNAAQEQHGCHALEVSTKSSNPLGISLSAFRLEIYDESRAEPMLLEAAYQGSKILSKTGHLTHLYEYRSGKDIKHYLNTHSDEELLGFKYHNHLWPLTPATAFYDWLYLTAAHQALKNEDQAHEQLCQFDAFSDIEFNPLKAVNCQARACALYVALSANHELEAAIKTPQKFLKTLQGYGYRPNVTQGSLEL